MTGDDHLFTQTGMTDDDMTGDDHLFTQTGMTDDDMTGDDHLFTQPPSDWSWSKIKDQICATVQ